VRTPVPVTSVTSVSTRAAQAVLDRLISGLSLTTVLRDVALPYLAELGDRWERGTASIAQEHFASNVICGWLAGLARGWGHGHGPRAILACPRGNGTTWP
jgi:MerR family transcriptional regulator, light-induced transcriptional regulator